MGKLGRFGRAIGLGAVAAKTKITTPQLGSQSYSSKFFANGMTHTKLVLCARKDLKMGKGKLAAQCSHASIGVLSRLMKTDQRLIKAWQSVGQPTIVAAVEDMKQLEAISSVARKMGLPTYMATVIFTTTIRASYVLMSSAISVAKIFRFCHTGLRKNDNRHMVSDAGHTQLPMGTCTVVAVGPAPDAWVDEVTGNLKLM